MKPIIIISLSLILLVITYSCNSETSFQCNCATTNLSYNDSIINDAINDSMFSYNNYKIYGLSSLASSKNETYRLRMSHSFSSHTQFYTISKQKSGAKLEVLQFYETYNRDTIEIDKQYTLNLTEEEWSSIKKEINSTCYWANRVATGNETVCDGGHWILEGFDPEKQNCANRKHHIDACLSGHENKLGDLCRYIRKYVKEERLDILYNRL